MDHQSSAYTGIQIRMRTLIYSLQDTSSLARSICHLYTLSRAHFYMRCTIKVDKANLTHLSAYDQNSTKCTSLPPKRSLYCQLTPPLADVRLYVKQSCCLIADANHVSAWKLAHLCSRSCMAEENEPPSPLLVYHPETGHQLSMFHPQDIRHLSQYIIRPISVVSHECIVTICVQFD